MDSPDNQKEGFPWGASGQHFLHQLGGVGTSNIESGKCKYHGVCRRGLIGWVIYGWSVGKYGTQYELEFGKNEGNTPW
jgi:hypothetical protein